MRANGPVITSRFLFVPDHSAAVCRTDESNQAGPSVVPSTAAGSPSKQRGSVASDFTMTPGSRNLPSILKYFEQQPLSDEEEDEGEGEEKGGGGGGGMLNSRLKQRGHNDVDAAAAAAVAEVDAVGAAAMAITDTNEAAPAMGATAAATTTRQQQPNILIETPVEYDDEELADDVSLDEFMDISGSRRISPLTPGMEEQEDGRKEVADNDLVEGIGPPGRKMETQEMDPELVQNKDGEEEELGGEKGERGHRRDATPWQKGTAGGYVVVI